VVVPYDQSARSLKDAQTLARTASNFCFANEGAPPRGYVAVGKGPVIGPKQ
jgi:hypothetical protein